MICKIVSPKVVWIFASYSKNKCSLTQQLGEGGRAMGSYSFWSMHKEPRKPETKTLQRVAHYKPCLWQIYSWQQQTEITSNSSCHHTFKYMACSASPYNKSANQSNGLVNWPELRTCTWLNKSHCSHSELSNTVQECLECFSQQVLKRSLSRKHLCSHINSFPAHCLPETATVAPLFCRCSTQSKISSTPVLTSAFPSEEKLSQEMEIPHISNILVLFQTRSGSRYGFGR